MPIGTEDRFPPTYRFPFYVNDGSHGNYNLDLEIVLREASPTGQWTEAEMDAVAQEVLDSIASLPTVVGVSQCSKSVETSAVITETP